MTYSLQETLHNGSFGPNMQLLNDHDVRMQHSNIIQCLAARAYFSYILHDGQGRVRITPKKQLLVPYHSIHWAIYFAVLYVTIVKGLHSITKNRKPQIICGTFQLHATGQETVTENIIMYFSTFKGHGLVGQGYTVMLAIMWMRLHNTRLIAQVALV
jgi:hypothetical protein